MKKLLLILIATISLTSCQIKEEITFNKDGSGTYNLGADMSGMMDMLKSMGQKNDSIAEAKKTQNHKKKIDTIIDIDKTITEYKDSIKLTKEQQKAAKKLKGLKMRMVMNEDENKMYFSYFYKFKNVKQLDDIFKNLQTVEKMKNKKKDTLGLGKLEDMTKGFNKQKVSYQFKGKRFHRIVRIKKDVKEKQKDSTSNQQFKQFSKMFTYQLIYHFPSKIKDVGYKGEYKFSDNGKTIIIDIPFDDMDKEPKKLDFEITLE